MKRLVLSLVVLLTVLSTIARGQVPTQMTALSQHVVLVSIDGLRPEFYLDDRYPLPTLRMLKERGAHAKAVRGVYPTVTYPSHTTIVTGATPAQHGVYYNVVFNPKEESDRWYWESRWIKVPTLWDAARAKGLTTATVWWPVTVGANVTWNVPEIWSVSKDTTSLEKMRLLQSPEGLIEEIERVATGIWTEERIQNDEFEREEIATSAAAYILETHKPNLLLVHIVVADRYQHEEGREGKKVMQALVMVDHGLSKLLRAAERANIADQTTFVITGDHGFVDTHTMIAPNVWLAEDGLIRLQDGKRGPEWEAVFHIAGASAFLHTKKPNDKKTIARVLQILESLPSEHRKLFRIIDRNDLAAGGADPRVGLALDPAPGVYFIRDPNGEPIRPSKSKGKHGYYPDLPMIHTGFVAAGPGIRKGVVVPKMSLTDIAPLVAKLLDLDFQAPAGTLYPEILEK